MSANEKACRCELPPEEIAKQSVDRFSALAKKKYLKGQAEHGGCLVNKVKLADLEDEIIDLWHYVYALRLRYKDE